MESKGIFHASFNSLQLPLDWYNDQTCGLMDIIDRAFPEYATIGAALNDGTRICDDLTEALKSSGSLGSVTYKAEHASTYKIEAVTMDGTATGWRTFEKNSALVKLPSTVSAIFRKFSQNSKTAGDRNIIDATKPESIQSHQERGHPVYCQSQSIKVSPLHVSTTKNASQPTTGVFAPAIDLFSVNPETEVVFANITKMDGVSDLFFYFGEDGSSTCFHVEDGGLKSLFYSLGPGLKYWLIVSREQFPKLLALYAHARDLGLTGCAHEFLHKRFARSLQFLLENGIDVYLYVQKPGELMILNCLTLHEVTNVGPVMGFTKNFVDLRYWLPDAKASLLIRDRCSMLDQTLDGRQNFAAMTMFLKDLLERLLASSSDRAAQLDMEALSIKEFAASNPVSGRAGAGWLYATRWFKRYKPIGFGEEFTIPELSRALVKLDEITSDYPSMDIPQLADHVEAIPSLSEPSDHFSIIPPALLLDKVFRCDVCTKMYKSKQSLQRHVASIHVVGDDRFVACGRCGKRVNSLSRSGHVCKIKQ